MKKDSADRQSPNGTTTSNKPQQKVSGKSIAFKLAILTKFGLAQLATIMWLFDNASMAWAFRALLRKAKIRLAEAKLQHELAAESAWYAAELDEMMEQVKNLIQIVEEVLKESHGLGNAILMAGMADETKFPEAAKLIAAAKLGWFLAVPKSFEVRTAERAAEAKEQERVEAIKATKRQIKEPLKTLVAAKLMASSELDQLVEQLFKMTKTQRYGEILRRSINAKQQSRQMRGTNEDEAYRLTCLAYRYAEAIGLSATELYELILTEQLSRQMQRDDDEAKKAGLNRLIVRDRKAEEKARLAARAERNAKKNAGKKNGKQGKKQ